MDQGLLELIAQELKDMWLLIQALCCGFEFRVDFFFIISLFNLFFSRLLGLGLAFRVRVRIWVRIWVGVILSLKKVRGQVLVTRCSRGSEIALTLLRALCGGMEIFIIPVFFFTVHDYNTIWESSAKWDPNPTSSPNRANAILSVCTPTNVISR